MHYNHDVYGGLGAAVACPKGSISMAEYGAVLKKKMAPFEACFAEMTGNARFSGVGGVREQGAVMLYAAAGMQAAFAKLKGNSACVNAEQRALLDEYVAIIGILCRYPKSQELITDCDASVRKLEQKMHVLEQRPESCPTCPPTSACPPQERPAPPQACPMCPPPARPVACPTCETCPECSAMGVPCPACAAGENKPKYGLLLGVLAAGGITGFVLTRVFKKKKR